ncbi:MAG: Mov34/MPN/PAD-1 family protein [Methermicoccaceae archaeon]
MLFWRKKKPKTRIWAIEKDALEFILAASRSSHPREFAALLSAEKGVITECILVPGTVSSEVSAVLQLYMLPNIGYAGSVHSHPVPDASPSEEDLALFSRTGSVHIIVAFPYTHDSWRCYDRGGRPRELEVV